jgi:glutamine amidotransferase
MIAIVDYGMGNLRSVQKAVEYLGGEAVITRDPSVMADAGELILPGVGAFGDAMDNLREYNLVDPIYRFVETGRPFLGICLGMQLIFTESEENGLYPGLGLIPGRVVRFDIPAAFKVPHMGWNCLTVSEHPLWNGAGENPYVYFVHSYHVERDAERTIATAEYGYAFPAAVAKGNVMGMQFHPEKSGDVGLRILKNFMDMGGER